MAYTAQELISEAFYKSQIVSREFGTVSGSQKAVGLRQLNKILSSKVYYPGVIPYYTEYIFNTIAGQESYVIPGLIDTDTLTFNLDSVRFVCTKLDRSQYQGTARANNVTSLPLTYHLEPILNGGRIFLYFKPEKVYPMTIWGKFRMVEVDYNDDLELSYDLFYIDYLEYSLAERLCHDYSFDVPTGVQQNLNKMNAAIKLEVGPMDTTIRKISTLNEVKTGDIYAQANLGKGWMP